jgi:hypothetical protein
VTVPQSTVVQRIRFLLGDNPWETTGETSSASSDIEVANAEEWAPGDIGEFLGTGDTFYVKSVEGSELPSVRGYYGSTADAHSQQRILKNPKYHFGEITNAITSVINFELPWPRIYKVASDSITPDITKKWYDLNAEAMGLVSVDQLSDSAPLARQRYGTFHKWERVKFERNLPTTLVASGVGVMFPDGFLDQDNVVYIQYATKITDEVLGGEYQDFSAGEAVVEAIVLGSVALMQSALELRKGRHDAQDTDNLRSGSYFGQLYRKALASAEKEIRQRHPLMGNLWSPD